jgi:hypothetical protein
MANALPLCAFVGFEPELCIVPLLSLVQRWH